MRKGYIFAAAVLLVSACVNNRQIPQAPEEGDFEIMAHRGVHTNWEKGTYDRIDGCEAVHIYKPATAYIENTLESIQAAFDYGATIVEIDIRRTADNHLVIFHDSLLTCRTDGTGRVEERDLAYLKTLDIGYGYTADNGETFPFRGKGKAKMPTLNEVLETFPERKFLIDQKDGSVETAELLVEIVKNLPEEQQERLYYWGADTPYAYVRDHTPLRRFLFTYPQAKEWIIKDTLLLGIPSFSEEWSGQVMGLPPKYRMIIRGWPRRALKRNHARGVRLFLQIDSEKDAERFSQSPMDGIITDYIEIVGPYFSDRLSRRE
ncbi:MAG: hypothetical protein JW760_09960 [Spirochaetales bacterium]|nr:hypothetical protein [Spirochaetales bacterium]